MPLSRENKNTSSCSLAQMLMQLIANDPTMKSPLSYALTHSAVLCTQNGGKLPPDVQPESNRYPGLFNSSSLSRGREMLADAASKQPTVYDKAFKVVSDAEAKEAAINFILRVPI